MLLIPSYKDSLNITEDIMALELTDDDTNSDYQPRGDEQLLVRICHHLSLI